MEPTTYIIEINYNENDIVVKGIFDGNLFKTESITPLHKKEQVVIFSFEEMNEFITKKIKSKK